VWVCAKSSARCNSVNRHEFVYDAITLSAEGGSLSTSCDECRITDHLTKLINLGCSVAAIDIDSCNVHVYLCHLVTAQSKN